LLTFHIRRTHQQISEGHAVLGKSTKISRLNKDKVLLVGMMESPHFQKWLRAVQNEFPDKRILVFPSDRPHFLKTSLRVLKSSHNSTRIFRLVPLRKVNFIAYYVLDILLGFQWRAYFLARFIMYHKPHLIHFHETQHAAYIFNLVSTYRGIPSNSRNILSTWGSDLTLYSWVDSHKAQISSSLSWTDLLTAEKKEEFLDATRLGYSGEFQAPVFITLGFSPVKEIKVIPPSARKLVLVKGYQDNPGRALNALNAISQLGVYLPEYEIIVYSASEAVRIEVDHLRNKHFINIRVLEHLSHLEMQELFKNARVSISISESDGLPGALVEAMAAGTFPIQSANSAAKDLIEHGVGGFIVDPWDLKSVVDSIRIALSDDQLVDTARMINKVSLEKNYSLTDGISRLRELYS
jgi:glycosyltransferase involved in cell wall biosynthesis